MRGIIKKKQDNKEMNFIFWHSWSKVAGTMLFFQSMLQKLTFSKAEKK